MAVAHPNKAGIVSKTVITTGETNRRLVATTTAPPPLSWGSQHVGGPNDEGSFGVVMEILSSRSCSPLHEQQWGHRPYHCS